MDRFIAWVDSIPIFWLLLVTVVAIGLGQILEVWVISRYVRRVADDADRVEAALAAVRLRAASATRRRETLVAVASGRLEPTEGSDG